jgi:hypothetical protein
MTPGVKRLERQADQSLQITDEVKMDLYIHSPILLHGKGKGKSNPVTGRGGP